jgi:hypothetical protein
MSILMYLAGIASIIVAAAVGYQASQLNNAISWVFAIYQIAASLGGALIFFGFGRGLDLLTDIANNSEYLTYLERLDPSVAEQREAERAAQGARKPFWRR